MNINFILLLLTIVSGCTLLVEAHAFLSLPISRNALGIYDRGYCSWGGSIPCHGCPHCWNVEEPIAGCGIIQSGSEPYVFGDGDLSYENTGVKTTYTQGQLMDIEVIISTYHGGRFVFYIQDVGKNADPDGSLWSELDPLIIESHSPQCDQGAEAPYGCAADPCRDEKTCMYIPLQPYGDHNYFYTMKVKLPDDLICEHCVLQWWWQTSNSCPGDYVACEGSEEFWNCADLEIVANGVSSVPSVDSTFAPTTSTAGSAPPTSLAENTCSSAVGDARCNGHGEYDCVTDTSSSCWRPVWSWPNDYCELRSTPCQQWEIDQGGGSWQSCCEWNDHCKGTGLLEPEDLETCSTGECSCFEGWSGELCDICDDSPTGSSTLSPTSIPVVPTFSPTISTNAPTLSPSQVATGVECDDSCYATVATAWYTPLVDAWCQLDCAGLVAAYPDRCQSGCRPVAVRRLDMSSPIRGVLQGLVSFLPESMRTYEASNLRGNEHH